jgi:hypothetical protein
LFARSRVFRRSFIGYLDEFLELAVGIRPSKPVPGPGELRARLQEEALELIDQWNEVWGSTFQQVSLLVAMKSANPIAAEEAVCGVSEPVCFWLQANQEWVCFAGFDGIPFRVASI